MVLNTFWGAGASLESKNADFRPKSAISEISMAENRPSGCAPRPKIFFWTHAKRFSKSTVSKPEKNAPFRGKEESHFFLHNGFLESNRHENFFGKPLGHVLHGPKIFRPRPTPNPHFRPQKILTSPKTWKKAKFYPKWPKILSVPFGCQYSIQALFAIFFTK